MAIGSSQLSQAFQQSFALFQRVHLVDIIDIMPDVSALKMNVPVTHIPQRLEQKRLILISLIYFRHLDNHTDILAGQSADQVHWDIKLMLFSVLQWSSSTFWQICLFSVLQVKYPSHIYGMLRVKLELAPHVSLTSSDGDKHICYTYWFRVNEGFFLF